MAQRPSYEELEQQIKALQIENNMLQSAKRKIEASEALYRIILENHSDAVIITDDRGKIVYACRNAGRLLGLAPDQVNERGTIQALIGGEPCDVSELKKVREIPNIEWAVSDRSGLERFLLITAKSVSINEGTVLFSLRDISERKETEAALLTSEQKWRNVLVNIPQIAISLNPRAKIVFANEFFLKLTGWKKEEIIGKDWFDLFIPENIKGKLQDIFNAIMTQKDILEYSTYENDILTMSGELRDIAWFNVLSKDVRGDVMDVTCVGIDVTERRVAKKELVKQKNLFETIFNTISDGVIITNRQREIKLANKGMESTFGYKPEELLGKSTEMIYADSNHFRKTGAMVFEENAKNPEYIYVSHYRKKDGREFIGEAFGAKLFDENHEWIGNLGIVRDITDRGQAEAALRKSEEKYRSMMESLVDPLYICSPDLTVEYMNPAMIRRVGRDATGENCFETMHGFDYRCDWCIFDKIADGDTIETSVKSPLDNRHFRVSNMPIQNQDGTISKMTIFRDITDYIEAVEEKEMAQKQLMQAQKMESIGNLAGGIAHDFNNILSSILGFTELALDDAQKGTALEDSLQEVLWAGKRAKDLVKQILAFARQSDEKRGPLQPSIIVKEALKFIRSTIPATIEIRQDVDSGSLIMANATQLHQVLMNLFTNAAQAMEDSGGVLNVSLKDVIKDKDGSQNGIGLRQRDYVEIMVSDTGTGIAPDAIGSIFDPYFTTKGPGKGSGMGLAIAHGIIESYGGKISVNSRLGKGTTFTLYLPVTGKRTLQQPHIPEALPSGTERILFVDDEDYIVKLGSQILERLGYSVTTRTSSLEALELFRAKPDAFDLVITDMSMPNMTGDKFSVELMKIRHQIPIILCTGYSQKISGEAALEIGIKAFAYKPMVKAELAKTVRKVLDGAKPQG